MKSDDLRKSYLNFFKAKGHRVFPSDSLVPDDPSLLFTSAGMNQFKPYFLGEKKDTTRAASCQKCLRTGDLENVGKTAYHHTFFEMLGNFSFGDYFKKEAIEFAWEFLTRELKIGGKDLWVSVYHKDSEAYEIWNEHIGVDKSRIVKLGEKSNFWPANAPLEGPDGPCGPCSEIFFDQGKDSGCREKTCNPDCSCGRFVEIWNLVFTQFNRVGKNKLEPLAQNNIDTGMGLERMASVLQKKASNFDIDILAPVVKFVRNETLKSSKPEELIKSSVNAIVDHARAATFAIADGVYPSNENRGYVIRKIIRRALLHSRALDNKEPFLYRLPEKFAELMHESYPAIKEKKDNISEVILSEEEKYFSLLETGKIQVRVVTDHLINLEKKKMVGAHDLFSLYDTYGLPLEFIREFAAIRGLEIDEKGFDKLLEEQKERSRKKSMFDENIFKKGELNLTEKTEFLGYRNTEAQVSIERVFPGEETLVILDKTPFYPEAGGQLSDKGVIKSSEGEFYVEGVFKVNEAIVHKGKVAKGKIAKGIALAVVDTKRRKALSRAHTATHLLQAALRSILGEHVVQQGSLVDEDEFRFDFTHFSKLTSEELGKVEELVRNYISSADKVEKKGISLEEAKKEGALAFFKDKYQDKVRVVSISGYSKELCGGIHVDNTSEIKHFSIVKESSISSGIRRIKALVGEKAGVDGLRPPSIGIINTGQRAVEKEKKAAQAEIDRRVDREEAKVLAGRPENINGVNFLFDYDKIDSASIAEESEVILRLSDRLRQKLGSIFIFITRSVEGKDIFVCSATDDLAAKGINGGGFVSAFGKELSLVGSPKGKTSRGRLLNRSEDFIERLKKAFAKFTKQ